MTKVACWTNGSAEYELAFSKDDMTTNILEDWDPATPSQVASRLKGIAGMLVDDTFGYLEAKHRIKYADRQWKSALSWMVGVAGARQWLKSQGFRYIAPMSAFSGAETYLPGRWPAGLTTRELKAAGSANSPSTLEPDYLAVDVASQRIAVCEAKGCQSPLDSRTKCNKDWQDQALNVELSWNGTPFSPNDTFVVATRFNPKAVKSSTRAVQIRSWKIEDDPNRCRNFSEVALDTITAHFVGACEALGLYSAASRLTSVYRDRSSGTGVIGDDEWREEVFMGALGQFAISSWNFMVDVRPHFLEALRELCSREASTYENASEIVSRVDDILSQLDPTDALGRGLFRDASEEQKGIDLNIRRCGYFVRDIVSDD